MKLSQNHETKGINGVERVEFRCTVCEQGYFHFDKESKRIGEHNQLPHKCTNCGEQVFFTIPYPTLRYKGRIFADWETIRALPPRT